MAFRGRLRTLFPFLMAMAVAVGFNAAFLGPMARDPAHRLLSGAFHGGHLWCFDAAWRMVAGLAPWSMETERLGFPGTASVQCLVVAPALLISPLRLFLDGLTVYNLFILAGPAVTVLFTMLLVQRVTSLDRWSAGAVGVLYAVSPYMLGCLAGGQTCKAQIWGVPLVLWTLSSAVLGPGRPWWVLASGAAGALLAFTEPTYATIVPLVAVPWVVLLMSRPWLPAMLGGVLALGACAAGIGGASLYYLRPAPAGTEAMFEPAGPLTSAGIPIPTPMAQPGPTLLGPPDLQTQPGSPNHVTYLGVPLLILMVLGTLPRWRDGRRPQLLAWSTLIIGFVVALGERLVMDNAYVLMDGRPLRLPARILADLGYPLSRSMMYYRGIVVASFGLAIGAVGLMGRWRFGAVGAWLIVGVALADTWRVLEPIWPLRSRVIPTEFYREIAEDPLPGAVVSLPLHHTTATGGLMVLDAALHGRASNGLARYTDSRMAHVARLEAWFREANRLPTAEASAGLYAHGVRYVVAGDELTAGEKMNLTLMLGKPLHLSGRMLWRAGPE